MHSPAIREQALALVATGLNDCEVARRTGISRTTIRDWRRPRYIPRGSSGPTSRGGVTCPCCGRGGREMSFTPGDYAELLGLYLGDGYLVRMPRTWRFRLYLDSKHTEIVRESSELLQRCFGNNVVTPLYRHDGAMTILNLYSSHLPCLFPQHGPGKKHERPIVLEPWQEQAVNREPWRFLRGCIRSDGCSFINRTGRYEYLSYEFFNCSVDILDMFSDTCDLVGVEYRRYPKRIRITAAPALR